MRRLLKLESCEIDLSTGEISEGRGRLTTRELALLTWLADRPDQDVPREELLVDVFGYAASASSRAVDKAMNSLRGKVEADRSVPRHLITVTGVGYRFVGLVAPEAAASESTGLPPQVDAFVGRVDAIQAVQDLLRAPGVITLVGPGGIGKTRLALHVAPPDARAAWVDLTGARSREDILMAIAEVLDMGLAGSTEAAAAQIGRALATWDDAVLILDNFEHLLEHGDLVSTWASLAPRIRLLVTSRQGLGRAEERIFLVEPLSVEDGIALLSMRTERRGYRFDADEQSILPQLVRRLDGLPLALELAAARIGALGARDVLERLNERLEFLRARRADRDPRHRTLRAVLDWSWALLDGDERTALAELSVFPSSFAVDAAEAVLSPPGDGRAVLDVLDELVAASLVRRRRVGGRLRLGLLETVRLYAAERLDALDPEARDRTVDAHTDHFVDLGQALGHRVRRDAEVARTLVRELDQLVAACRGAISRGRGPSAVAVFELVVELLHWRGPNSLAVRLGQDLSAVPLAPEERVRAGWLVGSTLRKTSLVEAEQVLSQALTEAREIGHRELEDRVAVTLGQTLRGLGRIDEARGLLRHGLDSAVPWARYASKWALAIADVAEGKLATAFDLLVEAADEAEREGDLFFAGSCRGNAGVAAMRLGCYDEAEALMLASEEALEAFGARVGVYSSRAHRGMLWVKRGDPAKAAECMEDAVQGLRDVGDRPTLLNVVGELGGVLFEGGRYDEALSRLDEAIRLARELRNPRTELAAQLGRAAVLAELGRVSEAIRLLNQHRTAAREADFAVVALSGDLALVRVLGSAGQRREALALLDEAEERLAGLGLGPTSELGAEAAGLRESLLAPPP